MANTFLSPTTIASTGLALLRRQIALPRTVNMTTERDFAGRVGDTINVVKPPSLTARTYTDTLRTAGTPIVIDDITETSVPLQLDTHAYHAGAITDEQLTLKIVDFARQVLNPQVVAVATKLEDVLVAKFNAVSSTITALATGADIYARILDARKALNDANVPMSGRWLAVSSEVEAMMLADAENRLVRYEASGDSQNDALREARVGRIYGFEVVVSTALTDDTALAYHQDAFAFATVAPAVPDGVNFGQRVTDGGMSLRWIRDYDAAFLRDRSIVSALAGAATLDTNRVVKITANGT